MQATGRDEIEHELAEVIADFCDRWLGKKLRTRHYNRASSLTAASSLRNIIRKYEKMGTGFFPPASHRQATMAAN
jgi:hypothetical protein